jgi:hypothetical protein
MRDIDKDISGNGKFINDNKRLIIEIKNQSSPDTSMYDKHFFTITTLINFFFIIKSSSFIVNQHKMNSKIINCHFRRLQAQNHFETESD